APAAPETIWRRRSGRSARPVSRSTRSPCASPRSTRCSSPSPDTPQPTTTSRERHMPARSRPEPRKETSAMTAIAHDFDTRNERITTGLAASTLAITRRAALRYVRTPQLIVMATIQMSLFFLIYRYMFGGAIHAGSIPYVDYLVPGFVATGVLFSGLGASVAMAEDL